MSPGISDGDVAVAAMELFEALDSLVGSARGARLMKGCTTESLEKAETILDKYRSKIRWLSQQGV